MKRISRLGLGLVTAVLIGVGAATPTQATEGPPLEAANESDAQAEQPAPLPENATHDEFINFVKEYRLANPHDLVGLDKIVQDFTGDSVQTSVNGSAPMTASEAQERYDQFLDADSKTSLKGDASQRAAAADDFMVFIQTYPTPGGGAVTVLGSWDWRDTFVGQGAPVDIAAIQLQRPDCVELSGYTAAAAYYDGQLGPRPILGSAGLNNDGVVWNVDARPIGFANQADNGVVAVTADAKNCPDPTVRVGAAFTYETNNGGSVLSVGAGWGAFNVSYSAGATAYAKSTVPVYTAGSTLLVDSGLDLVDQEECIMQGEYILELGGYWTQYRCVQDVPNPWWTLYSDWVPPTA